MKLNTANLLPIAIVAGLWLPGASKGAFLIQWLLGAMLFFAFLSMEFGKWKESLLQVLHLLPLWLVAGPLAYWILKGYWPTLAASTLLVLWAPTASAAAGVTRLRGGNPLPVAANVLVQHVLLVVLFPLWMQWQGSMVSVSFFPILKQLVLQIGLPLHLALLLRLAFPQSVDWMRKWNGAGMWLWAMAVFLVISRAGVQLRQQLHEGTSWFQILAIAGSAFLLCILQFVLGSRLSHRRFREEGSQMLGQKNTILAIWLGHSWFDPLAALGPTSYVIWQNLWLWWGSRKRFRH